MKVLRRAFAGREKLGNYLGGRDFGFLAAGLWDGRCGHGVGRNHVSTDSVGEEISQNAVEVHLGLWGEREGMETCGNRVTVDTGNRGIPEVCGKAADAVFQVGAVEVWVDFKKPFPAGIVNLVYPSDYMPNNIDH